MFLNKGIVKTPEYRSIIDRSVDIENTIDFITKKWEYDLSSYQEIGYSLDMISYLYSLLNRNIIITIPKYKADISVNLNEKIVAISENRHGRLVGLQGNGTNFSFSIKIIDMNVMNGDKLGEIRCFRLTNPEGEPLYTTDKLQIITETENKICGNNTKFDFFIDPNRWIEFYSEKYFITKLLIERLRLESSYYYNQIKKMLGDGIKYPQKDKSSFPPTDQKKEKKSIKCFVAEIFHPDFVSEFPILSSNQNNLIYLTDRRNKYIYSIVPRLNFMIRSIEYAFFKINQDGISDEIEEKIGNVEWKEIKIKRTIWNELNLGDIGIRTRIYEKMEIM